MCFLTYGDGVSDVNLDSLLRFHDQQSTLVTLTAVQPPGRFGAFNLENQEKKILSFREKPKGDGHNTAWINGGFFVLEPEIFDYIKDDHTIWERDPMENLAKEGQLSAYKHEGYWQSMDTLRDKNVLEDIWIQGDAPWKKW